MATARSVTEVVAAMPSKVGLLAEAAEALGAAGVNIMAISAYEREGEAKFLLLTSDNAKTAEVMRGMGASVTEKTVVALEMANEPGVLADAATRIAGAGVNIEYAFGSAGDADTAVVVFKTEDDAKVADLF